MAQTTPTYAAQDQQIHGRVIAFDGAYTLQVRDDQGYVDDVHLHQGTVINPTGITLAPGMVVSVDGYNAGSYFDANQIDTPYTFYSGVPYYLGHPWNYYGPTDSLNFYFGHIGWWHGAYPAAPVIVNHGAYAGNHAAPHRGGIGHGHGVLEFVQDDIQLAEPLVPCAFVSSQPVVSFAQPWYDARFIAMIRTCSNVVWIAVRGSIATNAMSFALRGIGIPSKLSAQNEQFIKPPRSGWYLMECMSDR